MEYPLVPDYNIGTFFSCAHSLRYVIRLHNLRRHAHFNWVCHMQGSHRLEKCLNLEGFLEESLKIKAALKNTGKSPKSLEKSLNSTIFCRT